MPRLERLRTATGDQLPRRFKEEIKRELQRLELVLQMIKAIETERDAIASAKASTHTNAQSPPDCKLCWTDAEPFSKRVNEPRSGYQQSGESQGSHHDGRAGLDVATSPTWQFFECLVPRACRHPQGPHSTHHHRAVARKLLITLWRYLEAGGLPTDIDLKKG
jgi:hypothetical protein